MLEKVSEAFTGGIKKITNAIFVDKKLIDVIIKDIQRALIEADVNVELVFKLSQNRDEKSFRNIISKLQQQGSDGEFIAEEMKKRQQQLFGK